MLHGRLRQLFLAACTCLVWMCGCLTLAAQAAPGPLEVVLPAKSCADLLQVGLDDIGGLGSKVTRAAETAGEGVPTCSVEGLLAPGIGFQVLLPTKTWTQRYLQLGCGGLCGGISLKAGAADGCAPLQAGAFVLASTDMGHQGMGGEFGRDPQRRADFAYRGVHVTALAAKKLIRAFYGRSQAYSYFNGCSDGGREALVEAQRYPEDFNGIVAGAPAMNFQVQNSLYHGWQARSNTGPDGKPVLLAAQLPLLHAAVLQQCDALDGQLDGLIADPRACHPKLEVLLCKSGAAAGTCLSAPQVEAARRLYEGPRDPASGERLTIGGPQPGSELAWAGVFVPRGANEPIFSEIIAMDALRNLIFEQAPPASFRLADLRFDKPTFERLLARHPLFDATNPDLSAFAAAGGKLILWHGWSDPHISPLNTIAYHEAVRGFLGQAAADKFERLYLLPGVYHCTGGEGPSLVDFMTPMLEWVEGGKAPEAVVARQDVGSRGAEGFGLPPALAAKGPGAAGRGLPPGAHPPPDLGAPPARMAPPAANPAPARARPLFPYPALAAYAGQGDPLAAASYQPQTPRTPAAAVAWAGAQFYRPYAPAER
jgi:feruloyl esterase